MEPSAAVRLGELMQRRRDRRGLSQRDLGELLSLERSNLSQFETGARIPPPDVMTRWYAVIGRDAEVERLYLAALGQRGLDRRARRGASRTRHDRATLAAAPVEVARLDDGPSTEPDATAPTLAATDMTAARLLADAAGAPATTGDGLGEAVDLLRQIEASDLAPETLERVDRAVDRLCRSYSSSPPGEVRQEARRLLRRITLLLGGRLTLQQRRQLLVAAGWLSLLASALHYDVGDRAAADAAREVALQLGRQASHQEIMAWAFEAQAWFAVCDDPGG